MLNYKSLIDVYNKCFLEDVTSIVSKEITLTLVELVNSMLLLLLFLIITYYVLGNSS